MVVKLDGDGGYTGRLQYDFEQYGRMVHDDDAAVSLRCRWDPHAHWLIRSTSATNGLAGFGVFMHAMNHYLFVVLQFDPVSQWHQVSDSDYEYCFERVYFDMGTQKFNAVKKISVSDSAESARNYWTANIRS